MFVRKKNSPSNPNTYVQLANSTREDGKVKQHVIKHIGTASDPKQLELLVKLGEQLKAMYQSNASEQTIDQYYQQEHSKIQGSRSSILNCTKIKRKITGIHSIYGKVFDELKLNTVLDWNKSYSSAFKDIVMARISSPSSKRKAVETLEEDFDITYSLNTIYRMMDKLNDTVILKLQEQVANYSKELVGGTIQVLFYDVTTIYFESFTEDELKKLGYSKDNKFNQPQIVLTLLVTEEGLPLGYQLMPGNTYEGNTLLTAISQWRRLYKDVQFVLVADSGMLNDINLSTLDEIGVKYIVCARIKNLPKATKQEILSYKESSDTSNDFYFALEFSKRNLILSYKVSRACKDRYDRSKAIDRLSKKLKQSKNPANLISNYGYKKFISVDSNASVNLNEEKIEESERWDGLHGLITNIKEITPEQAYAHYKGLWQIEDSFRINKSDLKIRPIFHWSPERIHAHIAISYVAYACYKAVEYTVNRRNTTNFSHRQIKAELDKVGTDVYQDRYTKDYFALPEPMSEQGRLIYKALGVTYESSPYCCTLSMAS